MSYKVWSGKLGPLMKKHLALRTAVGRVSKADEITLFQLNQFMNKNYPKAKTLSRVSILDFLRTKKHLKISGRKVKVVHIRQFCKFLNERGIDCYIPDKTLIPKYRYKPRYYPLRKHHIINFMSWARCFRANEPYVGETYAAALGLLWCTGLRAGELTRLNHEDVDFDQKLILIRQTKFFKDRIIPFNMSVSKALNRHIDLKEGLGYSIAGKQPFFTNFKGLRLKVRALSGVMQRIGERAKLKKVRGRRPSLHDFRHNFATQTMAKFFTDPEKYPPSVYMPRLSTYLGHTTLFSTQYYLHPDFDLIQKASEKFRGPK